jgi:hypothetical protein
MSKKGRKQARKHACLQTSVRQSSISYNSLNSYFSPSSKSQAVHENIIKVLLRNYLYVGLQDKTQQNIKEKCGKRELTVSPNIRRLYRCICRRRSGRL